MGKTSVARVAWRASVAMVGSAALVAGFVTPVYGEELPDDQSGLIDADVSEQLEVTPLTFPEGQFDPRDELELAEVLAAPNELFGPQLLRGASPRDMRIPVAGDLEGVDLDTLEVIDRDSNTTTYRTGDGLNLTAVSELPQNVELDGQWEEISTTVSRADALLDMSHLEHVWLENCRVIEPQAPLLGLSAEVRVVARHPFGPNFRGVAGANWTFPPGRANGSR